MEHTLRTNLLKRFDRLIEIESQRNPTNKKQTNIPHSRCSCDPSLFATMSSQPPKRQRVTQRVQPQRAKSTHSSIDALSSTGPTTMQESDSWPDLVLESLEQSDWLDSFSSVLSDTGVRLGSDYSGLGTAEEALRCLSLALSRRRGCSIRLDAQRASDKEVDCRTVLLHSAASFGFSAPFCVQGDIGETL